MSLGDEGRQSEELNIML